MGWLTNIYQFLVSLPEDKYNKYLLQVKELICLHKAKEANLQSLIGRLECTVHTIPDTTIFLNRLRHLQYIIAKPA